LTDISISEPETKLTQTVGEITTLNVEKSTKNDEKLTKTGGEASDDDDFEVLDPEEDLPDEICDQGSPFFNFKQLLDTEELIFVFVLRNYFYLVITFEIVHNVQRIFIKFGVCNRLLN
jgi:hypothetical protein